MVEINIADSTCVFVEWEDSASPTHPDTWISKEEIEGLSPCLIHTCGFLYENRDKYVVIVSSATDSNVSGVITIPKSAILSMVALGETEGSND